jgi:cytochrome c oxidase subunit 2
VDTRRDYLNLQDLYLPIAIAVWVLFTAVVVLAVVRGRRAGDPEERPGARRSAPKLEAAYAVGLTAIAVFLVATTFGVMDRVDRVSASPGLRVHAISSRWQWRFEYPGLGVVSASTGDRPTSLVVPQDTTIHFTGTARDVIHAFWVPERRFKRDLFPGGDTRWDLRWPRTGFFGGECGEFCGLNHASMRFNVEVLDGPAFRAWVDERRREGDA